MAQARGTHQNGRRGDPARAAYGGYTTGHIWVQGDPMEDKSLVPFSDQERLPHEHVAHLSNHKNMQPVNLEKTTYWKS